jgi:DNA (cytosine-5)-methyltransferase 1
MALENSSPVAYSKKLPDPKPVYVVDFFSGCGGMSYGFANTRQSHLAFQILAGIDIDATALATFEQNVGAPGIKADVAAIAESPSVLRTLVPGWDPDKSRPLVFIGCAPCQGFSALRKGDHRDDERNNLLLSFASIAAFYRPDVVVMENVPEVINGRFAAYMTVAAAKLKSAGYVLRQDILDFSRFGVPQRRKRAIIIGGLGAAIDLPAPIFGTKEAPTVRNAIAHLRPLEASAVDKYDPMHRAPEHTSRLVEVFRQIPANGGDRRALPRELQLSSHRRLDQSDAPGFTDVYGRLRWDTPSVTITAKSRSPSSGRFLHPDQHRNISVREAAILQGFPQSFVFSGSPTQQYRHIGEAVPPLFARFLAWRILDHLRPPNREGRKFLGGPVRISEESTSRLPISVVDCFSGAGGISLGFKAAGLDTAFAFDVDASAVATFRRNISENVALLDIHDPSVVNSINEAVDSQHYCIVGGPPCQGFSHQRRGASHDPRNELVLDYAKLIARLRTPPSAVILENVTDLDLPRGRPILEKYLAKLATLGYEVFRHDLNCADFDVPQLRNRIVIVGLLPQVAQHYRGPKAISPKRWKVIGESLSGLPEPGDDSVLTDAFPNHVASQEGELNRRRIAFVDMGAGRKLIPPDLQLPCHANSYRGHRDVYGRLDWFSQARTLTSGFDSFTRGEFGHPFRHRSITAREAARIQGFPDWFVFEGNRASVRSQIGNAVPPTVSFAIAKAISRAITLAGER